MFNFTIKPNIQTYKNKKKLKKLYAALNYKGKNGYENRKIHQEAIVALGDLRDSNSIPYIIKFIQDNNFEISETTAEALDNLGWLPGNNEVSAYYYITKENYEKLILLGEISIIPIIKKIQNPDKNVYSLNMVFKLYAYPLMHQNTYLYKNT